MGTVEAITLLPASMLTLACVENQNNVMCCSPGQVSVMRPCII